MIEIDGSFGSGGGQILRTAVALSVVTQKPCRIFNVRKNRPKPGLAVQHLIGLQALARLCNGKLEGDYLGSGEIKFFPAEIQPKELLIKIETAGSITLVLQTLVMVGLFSLSPIKINFEGGSTDTFFSPTIDHFRFVFLRVLEKMGGRAEINIKRRGYYPEGGARVQVTVHPSKLKGIEMVERGGFEKILVISGASESLKEQKVAERQIAGTREILGKLKLPIEERAEYYDTVCPGSQICLIAEFDNAMIGADNLGKLGKRAEDVGREAALELLKEQKSEGCLDKHLTDQILPYLALAGGKSRVSASEITEHCQTSIWVIEKFLDGKFEIKDNLVSWEPF
jgi:RNA 3'-terminal phosphate cyclase (GTP)